MFYHLDVSRAGAVTRCEFEAAMLELGVAAEQAARVFDALDVDGDGVLSLDDWTHERVQGLARHISLRMIRRQLVGSNPLTAKRPPSSVRCGRACARRALVLVLCAVAGCALLSSMRVQERRVIVDTQDCRACMRTSCSLIGHRLVRGRVT